MSSQNFRVKHFYYISGSSISFSSFLFLVFFILKITNIIEWNWIWITLPLWIGLALSLFIIIIVFIVALIFATFNN